MSEAAGPVHESPRADASAANGRGPSVLRVVLLVSVLSLRRLANRFAHLRRRRGPPGQRSATARKTTGGKLLLAFLGVIFAFQAVQGSTALIRRTAQTAERLANRDVSMVSSDTFERVLWADQIRRRQTSSSEQTYFDSLRRAFAFEAWSEGDADARERLKRTLERNFETRGVSAFRVSRLSEARFWPDSQLWYRGQDPLAMLRPIGLVTLLLGLAVALQHVAGSDRDLAKRDAGFEWLFSFPVPARSLFLARVLEAAFTGPLILALVFPFFSVTFWCAGYGPYGVPLGAAVALYIGTVSGSLRVLVESTLRRYLSLTWVARIQAALLVTSYLLMATSVGVAYSPKSEWLIRLAGRLPASALYNVFSLPLWLSVRGVTALTAGLACVLVGAGLTVFSIWTAERMVRDGLTSAAGPFARSSQPVRVKASRGLLRGVALKELRALLRDRQLRAQALITPILAVALQAWLNPHLLADIGSNPRHVATAAFVTAMLVLTTGASSALATEGPALWMLYTAPKPLERLLGQKLVIWISLATLFAAAVWILMGLQRPGLFVASLPYLLIVLIGIGLYSVIALGLGTLGTDPLEAEPRRRIRPGSAYLFMVLAGMFSYALYVESLWAKVAQLVLSALLAFALWQKLKDQLPLLLDPTEAPPATIAVADGVMAALAFFVLQGLMALLLSGRGLAPGQVLLYGFVTAGLLVAGVTLAVFYKSGVPDLLRVLGLRRPVAQRPADAVLAIGLGIGVGLAAACIALIYLLLIARVDVLRLARDESLGFRSREFAGSSRIWLVLLIVGAAPLFEEFIFRGILYGGLRRSLSPVFAATASAAVFALIHPAVAAFPVFVLALGAALAYERSRWLATPIAAHMVYNAIVVGLALAT